MDTMEGYEGFGADLGAPVPDMNATEGYEGFEPAYGAPQTAKGSTLIFSIQPGSY